MIISLESRAVVPHSFFADPDPAVFLNVDPDPETLLESYLFAEIIFGTHFLHYRQCFGSGTGSGSRGLKKVKNVK